MTKSYCDPKGINEPVSDRLILLLNNAKDVAAALEDNCRDHDIELDPETYMMISRDLEQIKRTVFRAYEPNP